MIPRHLIITVTVLAAAALGLSIYAWHVRNTVFVAHDEDGTLRGQSAQIPMPSGRQQRAEELLRALLSIYLDKTSPHVIAPGAEIRSVFLVDPGVAVIDLNSAFADKHRSGVLVEELTVASLIHTVSSNTQGLLKVKILVDGKERDTLAGHADLSSYYDVAAVNQLASELQPQ